MAQAEKFLIKEVQQIMDMDNDNHKRLNPAKKDGIWVVGASRLANYNPLGGIHSSLPILLPNCHAFTELAMKTAHEKGHRGRDGTLATFRNTYWTSQGPKLAKRIKNQCQMCKLRDAQVLEQEMGRLPIERLKPAPPFNHTMLDLFGPYLVRGEVQKHGESSSLTW